MEKASEPMAARTCWSEYKHRYTAKILAGVTPNGGFSFVSEAYGGRISNPQIVKASGWLDTIEELDRILADKGFLIDDVLAEKGASSIVPPKKFNSTPKFPKWRLRRLGSDKQRWVWGLEVATAAGRLPSVK